MECTFCGMPLKATDTDVRWSDGEARDPFCNTECEVLESVHATISEAGNRRRRTWRRRVSAARAVVTPGR
ncbi:hypothetical protein [Streptomyces erythrochromogenes]|jgi:hypothetical protein|uniref:hypothetical protein n=1 Tax=Streptomyces erythrochromogenes TaxID=285574 RepID=UPI002256D7AC|nr:hypothetical protein [Streptomyces erythrochromogenes]MCX5584300.1 hypothetical protein [Streptomyces erythrochromogenes]